MTKTTETNTDRGWLIFLTIGAMNIIQGALLAFGRGEVVQNSIQRLVGSSWVELESSNPPFAAYIGDLLMLLGLFLAGFGLLVMAIAFTGYRRRQHWAWYSMWLVPAFYMMGAAILFETGEMYLSDDLSYELFAFLLVAALLVQVVDSRSFRPNR